MNAPAEDREPPHAAIWQHIRERCERHSGPRKKPLCNGVCQFPWCGCDNDQARISAILKTAREAA